jgi:hypothetical protein
MAAMLLAQLDTLAKPQGFQGDDGFRATGAPTFPGQDRLYLESYLSQPLAGVLVHPHFVLS